jgi:hypothetical protein
MSNEEQKAQQRYFRELRGPFPKEWGFASPAVMLGLR